MNPGLGAASMSSRVAGRARKCTACACASVRSQAQTQTRPRAQVGRSRIGHPGARALSSMPTLIRDAKDTVNARPQYGPSWIGDGAINGLTHRPAGRSLRPVSGTASFSSIRNDLDPPFVSRQTISTPTLLGSPRLPKVTIRTFAVRSKGAFSTTTTSPSETESTKSDTQPTPLDDEAFPLPLPRSLAPSRGLFLISLPIAPAYWPSHLDMYSDLYRLSVKYFKEKGREVVVNCIYDGVGQGTEFPTKKGVEGYKARLFRPGGRVVEWDSFSITTLKSEEFQARIDDLLSPKSLIESEIATAGGTGNQKVEILVCTHGSRDCRCSARGGGLVRSLRQEIEARGLSEEVQVGEIAHVGGHKYAANAILLPDLDMYSNLLPSDASAFLDHISFSSTTSSSPTSSPSKDAIQSPGTEETQEERSSIWAHWRGRYGTTTEEQAKIWASIDPDAPTSSSSANTNAFSEKASSAFDDTASPAGPVVQLRFKTWEGEERVVDASIGETLLQVARREDLPSMEGSCGGNLECSTCHVYIPPSAPLDEPSDSELDMLGYALGYREESSRLGCQVKVDKALGEWCADGGEFGLPRY